MNGKKAALWILISWYAIAYFNLYLLHLLREYGLLELFFAGFILSLLPIAIILGIKNDE